MNENENTAIQQALKSIRESWNSTEGITWDLTGDIFGALVLLGLFLVVIKGSKKYLNTLNDQGKK